jgi:hypothetical protein
LSAKELEPPLEHNSVISARDRGGRFKDADNVAALGFLHDQAFSEENIPRCEKAARWLADGLQFSALVV